MNNIPKKILIVGDGPEIQDYYDALLSGGFEVSLAVDGRNALRFFAQNGLPHILLLKVILPDMPGFALCERLHDLAGLPIVIFTPDAQMPNEASRALQYADDYVHAPYTADELVMRVRRVLSRIENFSYASGPKIQVSDWLIVDPVQRQINVRGDTKKLTPIENALLHVLLKHHGKVVDADTLIERVWRTDPSISDRNVLRVHIHRLRQKIEGDDNTMPPVIVTERGVGYAFVAN